MWKWCDWQGSDVYSSANTVLSSELIASRRDLDNERERAKDRENQLMNRIRRLTNRMLAAEIPRSKLVKSTSVGGLDEPSPIIRRRILSCPSVLPTMEPRAPALKVKKGSNSKVSFEHDVMAICCNKFLWPFDPILIGTIKARCS